MFPLEALYEGSAQFAQQAKLYWCMQGGRIVHQRHNAAQRGKGLRHWGGLFPVIRLGHWKS